MKGKYILGISAYYHDSSACLLLDGKIISANTQERFSRIKHDPAFPTDAILACLKTASIDVTDIDFVVFHEKPLATFERIIETYVRNSPRGLQSFKYSVPLWLKNKLFIRSRIIDHFLQISGNKGANMPKILFSSHHLSHAASAFYPSPFKTAAILCMDGVGEFATTTLWHGKDKKLTALKQINFPHSLGLLYSAFTYYCGFKVNDGEYKLMGLAPYGEPKYAQMIKDHIITIFEDGSYKLNMSFFSYETKLIMISKKFIKFFKKNPRKPESEIEQFYKDIASSIQLVIEEVIFKLVQHIKKETGEENICLAGGVALNCVANGKLLTEKYTDKLWIQPAASDSGSAIGAAYLAYYNSSSTKRVIRKSDLMNGCLLGQEFTDKEIETELEQSHLKYHKFSSLEELISTSSDLILNNKVIGWFHGRSEFGPRALGSRSILGNASSKSLQKVLNYKIKFRESFRPFAAAILKEDTKLVFNQIDESPYMLLVDKIIKGFPAVTHVNKTTRIQTVDKFSRTPFRLLLEEIKRKKGIGIVINTSFNIRSEPIVNSPKDAIRCFIKTDMDHLIIGSYLIKKEELCNIQRLRSNLQTKTPSTPNIKRSIVFKTKNAINSFLLTVIFFAVLTPYFLLLKLTYKKKNKNNKNSNWYECDNLELSDKMY